jgi:leucyl aminopeptidase
MEHNFKYVSTFKKTNIDIYTFIICNNLKNNIEYISKLLNISKIPKKIFDDCKLKDSFEKTIYTDNYEVLFIGLGKENKCNNENLYEAFGKLGVNMYKNEKNVLVHLVSDDENIIKNQIISYILGYYNFTDFKTDSHKDNHITYFYHPKKKYKNIINEAIYEGSTQNEIRSLINIPANILTSTSYVSYIKKNLPDNVKIKILNESQLKKTGCNLILGVNQGSKNKPYLVILEYNNKTKENDKAISLIGKGVMFDSGGYNIKHGNFSDMKNDMTGSAIVFGIFKLLSKFNIEGHFYGLLPLVENMVDANAIRPGDILKSYSGKTVEITDTDAEGRLIMADALSYSGNFNPYLCIDIATLTGQAVSIFDGKSSVIMGNNNKYIQKMINAGIQNNEKIWNLPLWEEYIDQTKSTIADYKNVTYEAKASTIMAGAFLSNFIPEKSNWIHLDIAGVDDLRHNTNNRHYGATGEILRSVFYFLRNINKEVYK